MWYLRSLLVYGIWKVLRNHQKPKRTWNMVKFRKKKRKKGKSRRHQWKTSNIKRKSNRGAFNENLDTISCQKTELWVCFKSEVKVIYLFINQIKSFRLRSLSLSDPASNFKITTLNFHKYFSRYSCSDPVFSQSPVLVRVFIEFSAPP